MSEKAPGGGLTHRLGQLMGLKQHELWWIKVIALGLGLGILFMNAKSLFGLGTTGAPPQNATPVLTAREELMALADQMSAEWSDKLSLIEGAGRVVAEITLASGPSVEPLISTKNNKTQTQEKAENGTRDQINETTDTSIVMANGAVAVAKRTGPEIAGVTVYAPGARYPVVKRMLQEAVMVGLKVPANRVRVFPAEGR